MSILQEILGVKKNEIAKLRSEYSLSSFKDSEFFNKPALGLHNSLLRNDRLGIIAEIKKTSPSRGLINKEFDHIRIAETYMTNKVDAISVLTDKHFFHGDINYLYEIANFKTVPLLRKDFIIDEYQIFEAKANGADAILLIAEALSKNQIFELTDSAAECGLEVLLELHSKEQLDKIDFGKNQLIGINNRNLDTFEVSLKAGIKLAESFPDETVIVSESGINSESNVKEILQSKVKAVLVGEHFMRAGNIGNSLREFKNWCTYES